MGKNLTPNPFPRGKGNRKERISFLSEKGDRNESILLPWWEGEPEGIAQKISALPRLLAVGAVAIYRAAVSPLIHAMNGPACRFEPSCSAYTRDAIAEYGIVRGAAMAIWRVARCNPMGGHGFDPARRRGAENSK